MFKKSLNNLKTSAPIRSSDRRKLKQRAVSAFGLTAEEGDALVPDGILSVKFSTHLDAPGVAYLDPDGDPLWFTIGKGSDDLIPTIYTLWRKEDLLPFLSTPAAVVPNLVGGADLMIPGADLRPESVIHCPPSLDENQLVSIRQLIRTDDKPMLSPPIAVGRMALPGDQILKAEQGKGKAVHISHTWKDYLWEMGSKKDIPENSALTDNSATDVDEVSSPPIENASGLTPGEPGSSTTISYSPQEVTELLNKSLLQAISTTLSSLPPSGFPITATLLYTNHILPSRPAFPSLVMSPTILAENSDRLSDESRPHIDTEITIKSSSHKSLTTFLKAAEKASLLTLKAPQKHQPDILVTSVNVSHETVRDHTAFVTIRDLELKAAKKAAREGKEKAASSHIEVKELWKPHLVTIDLFERMGASKSTLYSMIEIRDLLNSYIKTHNLVNLREPAYINLDDPLYSCVSAKTDGKAKNKDVEPEPTMSKFMKRDELIKNVLEKMQSWYEIRVEGKDPITKKGGLSPIQIVIKLRNSRKASTRITGFEPFHVIDAEEMADDLRKVCAGATSVSPRTGKPGLEVLVQGKQSNAVVDYLMSKGIPKKWIKVLDE